MTKKLPTVVFFGNERLATGVTTTVPTLRSLVAAGYHVAGVVINHQKARSRKAREPEIINVAQNFNIPIWYADNEEELIQRIRDASPTVGVLVAYGRLVSSKVIDQFPRGIVNIHPSLLPQHRGPTPIESTILAGETQTGVSLMKLANKMDAGPIYVQRTITVSSAMSKQSLASSLLKAGTNLLIQYLPDIINNKVIPKIQDEQAATYDNLINKEDGFIDWEKPAEQLFKEVKAYKDWPRSTAQIGSKQVIITEADVVNATGKPGEYIATKDSLVVYTGQKALNIKRLQPINKKEMSISAFLAGYKI